MGEQRNGEISGFHGWQYFLKEEDRNAINYYGHIDQVDFGSDVITIKYNSN